MPATTGGKVSGSVAEARKEKKWLQKGKGGVRVAGQNPHNDHQRWGVQQKIRRCRSLVEERGTNSLSEDMAAPRLTQGLGARALCSRQKMSGATDLLPKAKELGIITAQGLTCKA